MLVTLLMEDSGATYPVHDVVWEWGDPRLAATFIPAAARRSHGRQHRRHLRTRAPRRHLQSQVQISNYAAGSNTTTTTTTSTRCSLPAFARRVVRVQAPWAAQARVPLGMEDQGKNERKNNGAGGLLLVKIQDRVKSQIHPFPEQLMSTKQCPC